MILQAVCDVIYTLFTSLFGWINLPDFPTDLLDSINSFLDVIFTNLSLLGLIVRWNTVLIALPLSVVVENLDRLYKMAMWVLRKIPFLGIK